MATNRIETLDPALIRPGRIDRKIEFPLPDEKTKRRIFTIHTSRMTLSTDVNLQELIMAKDDLSGADIKVGKLNFISYGLCWCVHLATRFILSYCDYNIEKCCDVTVE
jgi:AAA+ superfamily predicted ATPase